MGLKSVGKKSDPDSTPAGESAFSMAASIFKLWSDLKAVQANSAGSQDEIQKSRLENPNKNKMFRGSIFIFLQYADVARCGPYKSMFMTSLAC